MPVITISSSFGTGGSVVAREVASALGWELVNRAITVEIAAQISVPIDVAEAHDERVETGWRRLLANLSMYGPPSESIRFTDAGSDEARLRQTTELVLRERARGAVVIVGRAAAIVLNDVDQALHVRLDGARQKRISQGAAALGLSQADAEARLEQTDRAREAYVRELYRRDWRDPMLYHLTINATAFSIEDCSNLILEAWKLRFGS